MSYLKLRLPNKIKKGEMTLEIPLRVRRTCIY